MSAVIETNIEAIDSSSSCLFRGGRRELKRGDVIGRSEPDYHGNVVYASPDYLYAAMYGLKRSVGGSFVELSENAIPYVILGVDCSNTNYFKELKEGTTYIAKVPYASFKPWPSCDLTNTDSIEWASKNPVKVNEVEIISNNSLLRYGIQVFTIDHNLFKETILNEPPSPKKIGQLQKEGSIFWENSRPEYDNAFNARPTEALRHFGIEEPFRQEKISMEKRECVLALGET